MLASILAFRFRSARAAFVLGAFIYAPPRVRW
jgi:hypothetical protein